MKTHEVAKRLGLDSSTLRAWTLREYSGFLSESARGGQGKARFFTTQDVQILGMVADMRNESVSHDDIRATLAAMQKEGWRDLPPMPDAPGIGAIPVIPREAAEEAISAQRQALMREIRAAELRIDSLEKLLTEEKSAHENTRQQYTTALSEAAELRGRLATLEGSTSRERRVWLWALAALAVVAAVLLAVVLLLALGGVG